MHNGLINEAETPVFEADVLVSAIEQLYPVVFILAAVADFVDDDGFVLDDDRHSGRAIWRQFAFLVRSPRVCARCIRNRRAARGADTVRRPGAYAFAISRAHLHEIGFLRRQPCQIGGGAGAIILRVFPCARTLGAILHIVVAERQAGTFWRAPFHAQFGGAACNR